MPFEALNELERSLVKAATDVAHRPQFYRDFLESEIFFIQEGTPPETHQRGVIPAGFKLEIRSYRVKGKGLPADLHLA
jgi:hypothetical protein